GLSEDHHPVRVPPEVLDIVAHPLERLHDVHHPDVAGAGELLRVLPELEITQQPEPMIYGHQDDVTERGQGDSVKDGVSTGSAGEAAAMDREHHRAPRPVVHSRRIDVENQAVLPYP